MPWPDPVLFFCQHYRRDVSVGFDPWVDRDFAELSECKTFATEHRFCLETPGWRVLNFSRKILPDEEIKRQRARIMQTPVVRLEREYPFCEDLFNDDASFVDPQLPIRAKVSSL